MTIYLNKIKKYLIIPKNVTKRQENPAPNKKTKYGSLRPSLSKITCVTI